MPSNMMVNLLDLTTGVIDVVYYLKNIVYYIILIRE